MLKKPKAVVAAIALHLLWMVAVVVGAVIESDADRPKWVWIGAWAIVYAGVALWSLLARWRWAWALNALYFGGFALVGVLAVALARIPAGRLWKYWPFMVIFAVYAAVAIAMLSSVVRRYFGRGEPGAENAAA